MQEVHATAPVLGVALPAAQGVGAVEPSGHAWPSGHVLQPACDVSPVALLKEPDAHGFAIVEPPGQ